MTPPTSSHTQLAAGVGAEPALDRERSWKRLTSLACVVLAGLAAATAFHHINATVLGQGYPQSTFLFRPDDRFNDLVNSWQQARSPNPYFDRSTAARATYFPLAYALLALTGNLAPKTLIVAYLLLTYVAVGLVVAGWLRAKHALWRGDPRWPAVIAFSFIVAFLSYPLLFAVDRGNIDPLLMALIVGSLMLLDRDRPLAGAVVLALAVALKGYPLIVFALWLRRGRVVAAVAGGAFVLAFVVLPGLAFDGGIHRTLEGLQLGLSTFKEGYIVGGSSAHFSADWINAIRLLAGQAGLSPRMAVVVTAYQVAATLLAAVLTLHAILVARPGARALLAVIVVMLTFPNVTNDYKLVLLLPVALAWVGEPSAGAWRDRLFAVAVGLLLIPKQYAFFSHSDASLSCAVSPLLVTSLVAVLWPTSDERARARHALAAVRARFFPCARTAGSESDAR